MIITFVYFQVANNSISINVHILQNYKPLPHYYQSQISAINQFKAMESSITKIQESETSLPKTKLADNLNDLCDLEGLDKQFGFNDKLELRDLDLGPQEEQSKSIEPFPSFSEIQKGLYTLRKAFPETFTDQVVDALYQNLMKKRNIQAPIKPVNILEQLQIKGVSSQIQNKKTLNNLHQNNRPSSYYHPSHFDNTSQFQPKRKYKTRQYKMHPSEHNSDRKKFKLHKARIENDPQNQQKGIAARLQSIWNQQFQQNLLYLYKKGHQFSYIRDYFQEEYPQQAKIFSVNSLRGKFYKIIRQTVRKLYQFIEQMGAQHFPEMTKLSYNIIQNIMYYQEGRFLRVLLVELYFCDHLNKVLIQKIIDGINQFIMETKDLKNCRRQSEQGYF